MWSAVNTQAAPTLALLQEVPPAGRLQVFVTSRYVGALPPVLDHLAMYHVARGGLYASDMFADPHLPVRPVCPNEVVGGCRVIPNYVLAQKGMRLHLPPDFAMVGQTGEFTLFRSATREQPLLSHLQPSRP